MIGVEDSNSEVLKGNWSNYTDLVVTRYGRQTSTTDN